MTRRSPAVNVTTVSEGGGPDVSSTMASARGIVRVSAAGVLSLPAGERAPPQAATARQSQLARPHSPRDIPAIDSLVA